MHRLRTPYRILLIVALVVMVLPLAQQVKAQGKKIKIGFVSHVKGNAFIQQIFDGATAAAKDLDVDLVTGGTEAFDPDAELKMVQDFIAAGADGVATSIAGDSMANGLNDLIAQGKPIVQYNLLSTKVKAPYVGERSTESGRILGRMVLDKIGGDKATGTAVIGICAPGFPVLENRGNGVKESLAKASGLKVVGPFDVKVDAADNYAHWEQLLAANTDVKAMIGLCAPDVESLGQLNKAKGDVFVGGGYDLTEGNLKAIKENHAYVTLGQSPFVQGYLPVYLLVDSIRNKTPLEVKFYDSGSQVITANSIAMGNKLPSVSFDEAVKLAGDPAATAKYYAPWVACLGQGWKCMGEPIENEGK